MFMDEENLDSSVAVGAAAVATGAVAGLMFLHPGLLI
jgi:hypothetical protein